MIRRMWFDGVVIALIAGVTSLATGVPIAAAAGVAAVSVLAVATAIVTHGGQHAAAWRQAWWLFLAGLTLVVTRNALSVGGPNGGAVDSSAWTLVGVGLITAAVLWLVHQRDPSRAGDAAWQAVLSAAGLGFVVWTLLGAHDAPAGTAARVIAVATPLMDLVALWLLARLVSLTGRYPSAYRYVIAGMLCLFTVHGAGAAGSLTGEPMPVARLDAIELWAYCLVSAGVLHLSLRTRFDSVPVRSQAPGAGQLTVAAVVAVIGPLGLGARVGLGGDVAPAVLLGSAALPLLVVVRLVRQIRERATAEYRAQHDALTGLPNRTLFDDRLTQAIADSDGSDESSAVMFLDLDRFKNINDSLGHHIGNKLLQAVAQRLRAALREDDTVARFGGDEFVVLLGRMRSVTDCEQVARDLLATFDAPFLIDGRQLVTSASVGVAMFPRDGRDGETLIKHADTAMYRAKAAGRGTVQHYTSDMSARARVRQSIETNLHAAIDRGELTMHYQPKLSLTDLRVTGVEALARWWQPKLGFISPAAFIPVAEESGLILSLGEWALDEAFRQGKAWQDEGLPAVPVAVNMSARQFLQQDAADLVAEALERTDFDPKLAELELTETIFFRNFSRIDASLNRLKRIGVRCAIDDFGTGFSGMQYLAKMSMDALKIDRSFVSAIGLDTADTAIVQAIIALAHSLDMSVIAEGVETYEQAQYLRELGCDEMQGYFISPPMPSEEMTGFLRHESLAAGTVRRLERRPISIDAGEPLVASGFDGFELQVLLLAACTDTDDRPIDLELVARVLRALQAGERRIAGRPWSQSVPMRVAVGTFAGLVPLSGGMAAAGTLPPALQHIASNVLERGGIEIPRPHLPAGPLAIARPAHAGAGRGQHGGGQPPAAERHDGDGRPDEGAPSPDGPAASDGTGPAAPGDRGTSGDAPGQSGKPADPGHRGTPENDGGPSDPGRGQPEDAGHGKPEDAGHGPPADAGTPADPANEASDNPNMPTDAGKPPDAGQPENPSQGAGQGAPVDPGAQGQGAGHVPADADAQGRSAGHGVPADPGSQPQSVGQSAPADPGAQGQGAEHGNPH